MQQSDGTDEAYAKFLDVIKSTRFNSKIRQCKRLAGAETQSAMLFHVYRNDEARRAFIERSERGLNLSDRVWQSCRQLRDEMEMAITVAVGEGEDAGSISRQIRHCLNNPDDMFRRFRYKDEDGNWQRKWKKRVKSEDGTYHWTDYDINDYHTGRGVYRSSAKNAMRVARTETNIAYRRADHERWQKMDFVLGQRVQLSKNHPMPDICDELAGDYPKDFVFDGWHPQCFCFVTPILVDEDEIMKMNDAFARGEQYTPQGKQITDYPDGFKAWVRDNADKIAESRARGTEPYFVRNNPEVVEGILKTSSANGGNKPPTIPPTDNVHTGGDDDDDKRKYIEKSRIKFNSYPFDESNETKYRAFDESTGGYYVTMKGHQFSQVKPKSDTKPNPYLSGGEAELRLVGYLYKQGKQIKLLPENGKSEGKPDLTFDDRTWDSKYIPVANIGTIRTYIKDARKADCVIFHWENTSRLEDLRSAVASEVGRHKKLGKLSLLPDIYWIDENGILRLLWSKK